MNAVTDPLNDMSISPEQINSAIRDASHSGRKTVHVLEEMLGMTSANFTKCLASIFDFPYIGMEGLRNLEPAFDLLPFNQAARKECIFLRDDNASILFIFHDPFDLTLMTWAEEAYHQPFKSCLAQSLMT